MSGNKNRPPTTSQKHRGVVSEPAYGRTFEEGGIPRADQLLVLKRVWDHNQFQDNLKNTTGANAMQQRDAYNGMREWTDNNL